MDEIAGQLGVSKKTIYQSFSDKNELVEVVILDILNNNMEACKVATQKATNAIEEVFMMMETLEAFIADLNPAFVIDVEKGHPRTYKKFEEYKNDFLYRVIRNNMERGKKEGLYRQEMNSDIITKMRLETVMIPFNSAIYPRNEYPLLSVQKELVEYFLYGMATVRGNEVISTFQQERAKQ